MQEYKKKEVSMPFGVRPAVLQYHLLSQAPVPPLEWQEIYADAHRPLVIDVGCGKVQC